MLEERRTLTTGTTVFQGPMRLLPIGATGLQDREAIKNRSNSIGGAREAANNRSNRAGGAREDVNNRTNIIGWTREGVNNKRNSIGGQDK